jgi:hypothetical protein
MTPEKMLALMSFSCRLMVLAAIASLADPWMRLGAFAGQTLD